MSKSSFLSQESGSDDRQGKFVQKPSHLDLGRDELRSLMRESGMNPVDQITREDLMKSSNSLSEDLGKVLQMLEVGTPPYPLTKLSEDSQVMDLDSLDIEIDAACKELL
ncbi:hypothetical protein HDU83_004863 [Entophlyctis luteolus]|nr:hypothetical protein HDU83_004863 [Entophlyctis luteolus]